MENWGDVFQSTLKRRNTREFLCADVGLGSIPTERHGGTRHLLNTLWIKVPDEGPHFLVTVSSYRILMRTTLSKENRQLAWHQAIWFGCQLFTGVVWKSQLSSS